MRIVIDARMYGLENAGIGRYIINLIDQLEKLDQSNEYFLLLRKKYFQNLKFKTNRFQKVLADYNHYTFKEQLRLPLQLLIIKPDLVHFPHFNVPILWRGKQVVTIHDLIMHKSKGPGATTKRLPLYWFKYLVYRLLIRLAVVKADKIIVPSNYWRNELIRRYRLNPARISITYEGVDEKFKIKASEQPQITEVLNKYKIEKQFIIYVGNLYPHKNINRLLRAIVRLNEINKLARPLMLAVVCSRSIFYDRFQSEIEKLNAEKLVRLAGYVSDEELIVLYRQAKAFVYPSLIEGFGLQGIEAMTVGCPVLASNIPVFKEIYGQAAEYFDPLSVEDICQKINTIVSNQKLREKLINLGFGQAEKYSWQKMAMETLKVYKNLVFH